METAGWKTENNMTMKNFVLSYLKVLDIMKSWGFISRGLKLI